MEIQNDKKVVKPREVSVEEAKALAKKYHCLFTIVDFEDLKSVESCFEMLGELCLKSNVWTDSYVNKIKKEKSESRKKSKEIKDSGSLFKNRKKLRTTMIRNKFFILFIFYI